MKHQINKLEFGNKIMDLFKQGKITLKFSHCGNNMCLRMSAPEQI